MAAIPPVCDFGWKAPGFDLPATDGRRYRYEDIRGPKGTLVMFICNHCPYVQAILPRLVPVTRTLLDMGIGVAAISSNDPAAYPEDSFEHMQRVAQERGFPFPYLYDETQEVARAWGAVCTPDFFGFNAQDELQYRGRFDASRKEAAPPGTPCDLLDAMRLIAQTGQGPRDQVASIGCSIKWRSV